MPKNLIIEKIYNEYLTQYPDLPTLTLARLIYKNNPEVFKNLENVRQGILYRRGKQGKSKKQQAQNNHSMFFRGPGEEAAKLGIPHQYYTVPESDADDWQPYVIPKNATRVLILSDVHIPYHDIPSLTAAVEYGKKQNANAVILNGDIMDCYALSRYEKDPRKRRFKDELEATRQFLQWLKQELPNAKIYYKIGNHEERYEAYLRIKAPELLDLQDFRLDVLLRFGEMGIELITDKRIMKLGKLNILHGHEFGRSVFSPVNPARGYYMRSKTNILAGHNHQTSSHSESDLNGKSVTAWSTGCLSELHPQYMPINRWNHGFAYVTVDSEGDFEVDNLQVIKGRIR